MPERLLQAVVVGGSIAGVLAAAALAPRFARVLVLEQDAAADDRTSVPQREFIHVLLRGGAEAIEELLPGFAEECRTREKARTLTTTKDVRFNLLGFDFARGDSEVTSMNLSRASIERALRARLLAVHPNVEVRWGCRVTSVDADSKAVAWEQRGASAPSSSLVADFIVVATGRNFSRLVDPWVASSAETTINLAYACLAYECERENEVLDMVIAPHPERPRGAITQRLDGKRALVHLVGYHGDAPTGVRTLADFERWSGDVPDLVRYLRDAKATPAWDAPRVHAFPKIVRRYFKPLSGVVVMGDAACSVDPAFAQGVTKAAIEARALKAAFRSRGWAKQADLSFASDIPHMLTSTEAFRFPQAKGFAPPAVGMAHALSRALFFVCSKDAKVAAAFNRVFQLVRTPMHLVAYLPRIIVVFVLGKLGVV